MRLQLPTAHKKMAENAIYHEYEKLSTFEHCCFLQLQYNSPKRSIKGTIIRGKNLSFDKTCTTYKEVDKFSFGNKIKHQCISNKTTSTSETSPQSQLRISQKVGSFVFNQKESPSQKYKENKMCRNEILYASCRCCNILQRAQVRRNNLSSFVFSPLMQMFPLLMFYLKSFGSTQIKRRRQEIKSKSIMRLLLTIARVLCILQMTAITTVSAIEFSQEQSQYTSPPFLTIGQSTALTPVEPRIISLVNRENILKQFQQKVSFNISRNATAESAIKKPHTLPYLSCSSCQLRKAKNDSLESIKLHILSKLKLKEYPKIEVPRNVPENIIRDYYKKFDHNGRQRPFKSTLQADTIDSPKTHLNSKKIYNSNEDYMLSDDPDIFDESKPLHESNNYDAVENDDDEFPRVKSTYIFPTSHRFRHSRKSDFLSFRFEKTDEMKITQTILHIYIRGREWIAEHEPDLSNRIEENSTMNKYPEIAINVHLGLRRANSFNYTHTVLLAESTHYIPDGLGTWNEIDLKDLADSWEEGGDSNQIIVIRTSEVWMRLLVVTGLKDVKNEINALAAHIEVRTEHRFGRHRIRRSTSIDCKESDKEERCCRYPLKVNFTSFGWSFVVAPTDFDAYFCNGECKLGFLEQNPHTHIASLSRSASPCCSPTKMSSLTLLYFNTEHNLVISTIPNMTVDKCSCS